MRKNILISLIIICLVVVSTMPFYHIFYDVPVMISKERLTLTDTFMSTKAHWERYRIASPEEQIEIRQTKVKSNPLNPFQQAALQGQYR